MKSGDKSPHSKSLRGFDCVRARLTDVKDVAQEGPSWLVRARIAPEDPVVIERLNGSVVLFKFNPVCQESCGTYVASRHRIGYWNLANYRLGDRH